MKKKSKWLFISLLGTILLFVYFTVIPKVRTVDREKFTYSKNKGTSQEIQKIDLSSLLKLEKGTKKTAKQIIFQKFIAGYSVEKRAINVFEMGCGDNVTLIFGVFHGDEPQGKYMVYKLIEYLKSYPKLLDGVKVVCIPIVNPDGLIINTRTNANGVDINRNFPTDDWTANYTKERYNPGEEKCSEPETKTVILLLEKYYPDKIITIHSPYHCVNFDGPGKDLAEIMATNNQYPIKTNIGYLTPGSFGTYAGKELKIPIITLEVSYTSGKNAWEQNKEALLAAIMYQ